MRRPVLLLRRIALTLGIALVGALQLAAAGAAARPAPLAAREGFIDVPGGPVWYRVFGSGTNTPLLMLHGGPGGSSCAFEPLATLVSAHRPVVVYDQLGGGRSGRPMDRSLWTLERSLREVEAVRRSLGLNALHLLGSSWGAALAADYAIRSGARGIRSLILSGPYLSTRLWIADAKALRAQLPQEVQDALERNERAGTVHSSEYREATQVFYSHFLHHHASLDLPASCAESPSNQQVYEYMWGPTEFNATGTLLNFDITGDLGRLQLPVLLTAGRFDEARPETVAKFKAMIPGSRVAILEQSGHMAPLEEYREYARILEEFLGEVEKPGR